MNTINVGGRLLLLEKPLVMGIINRTPDSFYSASRYNKADEIRHAIEQMLEAGADIIDIGGASSRPNAEIVPAHVELERLIPVVEIVRQYYPDVILSVDTFRSEVVDELSKRTTFIVNDISGFSMDANLLDSVARNNLVYVLMHIKGTPQTMSSLADYKDMVFEILDYFGKKTSILRAKGIHQIVLDPGFGFAKNGNQNFELLNRLSVFNIFEYPILAGLSRKSFVYKSLGIEPQEALNGTSVLHMAALMNGAKILRVHDVKEAVQTIELFTRMTANVND